MNGYWKRSGCFRSRPGLLIVLGAVADCGSRGRSRPVSPEIRVSPYSAVMSPSEHRWRVKQDRKRKNGAFSSSSSSSERSLSPRGESHALFSSFSRNCTLMKAYLATRFITRRQAFTSARCQRRSLRSTDSGNVLVAFLADPRSLLGETFSPSCHLSLSFFCLSLANVLRSGQPTPCKFSFDGFGHAH